MILSWRSWTCTTNSPSSSGYSKSLTYKKFRHQTTRKLGCLIGPLVVNGCRIKLARCVSNGWPGWGNVGILRNTNLEHWGMVYSSPVSSDIPPVFPSSVANNISVYFHLMTLYKLQQMRIYKWAVVVYLKLLLRHGSEETENMKNLNHDTSFLDYTNIKSLW